MAAYNITRTVETLLDEHKDSPPSFTIQLYPEHWTLNGGSKFLYNNQVASLLDDVRSQRIPTDFLELFDTAGLPFYDGCMIVQLLDYRPPKGKDPLLEEPVGSHVVLSPNSESLWQDICLLNHKLGYVWTDQETLEFEAKILAATSPPLCLNPDPRLTRVANSLLRVSAPSTPLSLKRKAAAMEQEEEESEKARRIKIMQYMNPRVNRSTAPSYRILEVMEDVRRQRAQLAAQSAQGALSGSTPVAPPRYGQPRPALASPAPSGPPLPMTTAPTPVPGPAPAPVPAASVNGNTTVIQQRPAPATVPPPVSTPASNPAPIPGPVAPAAVPAQPPIPVANGIAPVQTPAPAVQGSTARFQTPRPSSTAPQPAIPPHMQSMYTMTVPRTSNTPPPSIQRPPSAIPNGVASSPVQRPASVAQQPQHTPRQAVAALPRQPLQPSAGSPQRQQVPMQPQAPSQQLQQPQQPQQQAPAQMQGPQTTPNLPYNNIQTMLLHYNQLKKTGQEIPHALQMHMQAYVARQTQLRQAQAMQNGRAQTPAQPQQNAQSAAPQGLQAPQQQQQQARNSPRGATATPALAAQQLAQAQANQMASQQQQQQQAHPQQPHAQQAQQHQTAPQQYQQSFPYHAAHGQHLRPVIHGQHGMLTHPFQAGNQQQAQQGQEQIQQHQGQAQQPQATPQTQAQAQMQAHLMAQYQYQYMQGMQGRAPAAAYQWPVNMNMARNMQLAAGHQMQMASAAGGAQAGKPAGS